MPQELDNWLQQNGFSDLTHHLGSSGGAGQSRVVENDTGTRVFIKYRDVSPAGFYEAEAEGLDYLRLACNLLIPEVRAVGRCFIAMDYIAPAPHTAYFWETLGHQLAYLHNCTRENFGFVHDNYCGDALQVNGFMSDGYQFFAEQRLLFQGDMARLDGRLSSTELRQLEAICTKLHNLVPQQPASLLHGDLWSGNVHVSSRGEPVFIDPAVYFAWGEIDLAMTQLFGGFPENFYAAYNEIRALENGWRERLDLYNLYPLLNHLNLFGLGYLDPVKAILKRYA